MRRDRLAARFPNDGDNDVLLDELGDLVAQYHVEAARAETDVMCGRLWDAATQIDRVRILYARGEYEPRYAELWRDAAREHIRDAVGFHTVPVKGMRNGL